MMKRIPLVFAFLLPPQVQELSWTWEQQGRRLGLLNARSISLLTPNPFFHRFLSWVSPDRIRYPDTASGDWMQIDLHTTISKSLGKKWTLSELPDPSTSDPKTFSFAGLSFRMSERGRRVELMDPKSPGGSAWLLDLPTQADSLEWSSDGHDFLVGLARMTNEIFALSPRSMRAIKKIRWDAGVEVSEIVSCPNREELLVEIPKAKAVTRVVRMRDWNPTGYTVFDLSMGRARSDQTQVLSKDCRTIYFAGPYGLQKAQY